MGLLLNSDKSLLFLLSYYQLEDSSHEGINHFLTNTVNKSLALLQDSYCISFEQVSTYCYSHSLSFSF